MIPFFRSSIQCSQYSSVQTIAEARRPHNKATFYIYELLGQVNRAATHAPSYFHPKHAFDNSCLNLVMLRDHSIIFERKFGFLYPSQLLVLCTDHSDGGTKVIEHDKYKTRFIPLLIPLILTAQILEGRQLFRHEGVAVAFRFRKICKTREVNSRSPSRLLFCLLSPVMSIDSQMPYLHYDTRNSSISRRTGFFLDQLQW